MRSASPLFALLVLAPMACALVAKSPALQNPLKDQLAKAETTGIEQAAKACLTKAGWKPDDVDEYRDGATVVSAKNQAKDRTTLYIQAPEVKPRVTGGPDYEDPFWNCLGRELASPTPAAPPSSADTPSGAEN
jgi:hypothetical protein